jgi:hypothetical protein
MAQTRSTICALRALRGHAPSDSPNEQRLKDKEQRTRDKDYEEKVLAQRNPQSKIPYQG